MQGVRGWTPHVMRRDPSPRTTHTAVVLHSIAMAAARCRLWQREPPHTKRRRRGRDLIPSCECVFASGHVGLSERWTASVGARPSWASVVMTCVVLVDLFRAYLWQAFVRTRSLGACGRVAGAAWHRCHPALSVG